MASRRPTGTVVLFNGIAGYGLIRPDDGSPDLFVHVSSIQANGYPNLKDGDAVEYTAGFYRENRREAISVTALGGGPLPGDGFFPGDAYLPGGARGRARGRHGPSRGSYITVGGRLLNPCYKCSRGGHMARDCTRGGGGGYGYGHSGLDGRIGGCYLCGADDHIPKECTRGGSGGRGGGGSGGAGGGGAGGIGGRGGGGSGGAGGGGGRGAGPTGATC